MEHKKYTRICGAKARQNNHQPCKRTPVKNSKRCSLHGGLSTGPKTAEGKARSAAANLKHGFYTNEAIAERRRMRAMMQEWRDDLMSSKY